MVNTRAKTKKIQSCFSQASMEDSDHQSTQSGALIGSNDDLLTEILRRLPVTSILRFKSVSKHWRWLLSHRGFTLPYDILSKSPGIFACNIYVPFDVENRSPPPFRSLDFCYDIRGIRTLQSCNGLLLCSSDGGNRDVRKYYVFNPTTKQFAIIPPVPGGPSVRKTICFMALAFHQTDCVHYKVLCVRTLEPCGGLFQIQIYSSDTGKWKISIESFSTLDYFGKGVYFNGAVYWAPSSGNHLYFKLDVEQLKTLPLPVEMMSSETLHSTYFGESRGHLHLILYNHLQRNSLRLNVYEMLVDHSGWFVKYQVQLDELPVAFPKTFYSRDCIDFKVVDVVRGEEEEDTFIVLLIPTKMITYNVHTKIFKQIFNLTPRFFASNFSFHRYIETLGSF